MNDLKISEKKVDDVVKVDNSINSSNDIKRNDNFEQNQTNNTLNNLVKNNNENIQLTQVQESNIDDIFNTDADESVTIWGEVLLSMRKNNDNLLYAKCNSVIKTQINSQFLYLIVDSLDNYNELNEVATKQKIQEYVNNIREIELQIKFDEENKSNFDIINFLKQKFGDKLIIQE